MGIRESVTVLRNYCFRVSRRPSRSWRIEFFSLIASHGFQTSLHIWTGIVTVSLPRPLSEETEVFALGHI